MRGRTIVGAGNWTDSFGSISYALGSYGGERMHKLTVAEMPSHNHTYNPARISMGYASGNSGMFMMWPQWHTDLSWTLNTFNAGGDQAHNIMQPFVAVHYIMKI